MKRVDLIRHKGNNHAVYVNRTARKSSSVPRHREINDFLARKICADLHIPKP
jgi:mRNA interferase HicA